MSSDWKGRGGGRPGSQPTLLDSNNAVGDVGANPPEWQGRGGGRYRSQASNDSSRSHHGDTGASQSGWGGRGGGRYRSQIPIESSRSHHGDAGASQSGWRGRGGGRHRPQPTIKSSSVPGDVGVSPAGWGGRGGGRHRPQPRISSSLGMAIQRAAVNATAKAISTIGQTLGMGFAARTLVDPAGAYVFSLEIDGVELAHFQDCSGIKSNTEVFEIKEGGVNHATHKLPGQSTWDNLVLSYGVTSDSSMLSLREAVLNDDFSSGAHGTFPSLGSSGGSQPKRFNGSIVIRNNSFREVLRYNFMNAWVVSWEGPKLESNNSALAISKVEIAHHGIEVVRDALMVTGWV